MTWIKNVKNWVGVKPDSTYLLLISPEKIPHLTLVSKGAYYSLTHKKSIVNEPFGAYFNFLKRSGKALLFVELRVDPIGLDQIFNRYTKANTGGITCLYPIREAVLPHSSAEFVYDLIPDLEREGLIQGFYHLNLDHELSSESNFELRTYPKEAIFSYIEELNDKYAKRS